MQEDRQLSIFVAHASALLTDHRPHGDGLIAFEYLRGLAERGHRLDVATQDPSIRGALPPNVRLHPIMGDGDLGPARKLVYALRVRRLFDRLSAERRYDLVHQLNPAEVGLTAFLPAEVPLVLGPRPAAWPGGARGVKAVLRAPVRKRQLGRASVVLVFNRGAAEGVRACRRVAIVPPGIDLEHFSPADGPAGSRRVLYLASLERRKGIFVLLDAFDAVAGAVGDVELHVAGTGSQERRVAERVARSPHRARISLLGRVEREDVPDLMRQATLYCLPSFGEPFGMTALEGMACGRPVVGTRAGGLAELVPDGGGGKVPPGDVAALATELRRLLEQPEHVLLAMGRTNRRAAEGFSWPAALDRLEAVYRETIRSTTGATPTSTAAVVPASSTGRPSADAVGS